MARSPIPRETSLPSGKLYINRAAHAAASATFNAFTDAAWPSQMQHANDWRSGFTKVIPQSARRSPAPDKIRHVQLGQVLVTTRMERTCRPCARHAMREVSCITGGWHLRVTIVHAVRKG